MAVVCAEPVEDPEEGVLMHEEAGYGLMKSYLRIEATSIMRGMSREKPSLLFERCIDRIWSAYEVRGDNARLGDDVSKDTEHSRHSAYNNGAR